MKPTKLSRLAIFGWATLALAAWSCGGSTSPAGTGTTTTTGTGGTGPTIDCGKDLALCGSLCVDTKSDGKNCGACDKACPVGQACVAGKCSFNCPGGLTVCGTDCVDTKDDPAHCGGCDTPCKPPMGAEGLCLAGQCSFRCVMGLADCNGKADDGCETTLATAKQNCGKCGNKCPPVTNGDPGCKDSKCGVGSCVMGFDNCDNDPSNGCETDLSKDSNNCGMCGKACSSANSEFCNNSVCQQGLLIKVEGHADVLVSCKPGDYSCEAKQICEKITGFPCLYQDYTCCGGATGSWYPNDGASGSSSFNFTYNYDFCPGNNNYGNICACNQNQMAKYGLAANHTYCGLGHWFRQ